MKALLFLLMLSLSGFGLHKQALAQQYTLKVQGVYGTTEQAEVLVKKPYSYRGSGRSEQSFIFNLYKAKNTQKALQEWIMHPNAQPTAADTQGQQLIKTWESTLSFSRYSATVTLERLPSGFYFLESISEGNITRVHLPISDYRVATKLLDQEALAYVSAQAEGGIEPGFTFFVAQEDSSQQYAQIKPEAGQKAARISSENIPKLKAYGLQPIFAMRGQDFAVSSSFRNSGQQQQQHAAHLYTDRSAYRPGQTAYFKGFFRLRDGFDLKEAQGTAQVRITGPQNDEVFKKTVPLNTFGSLSDSITFSELMPLGEYTISAVVSTQGSTINATASFQLEEYKKPEFEVNVSTGKKQYATGEKVTVSVTADYFFGEKVSDAEVKYTISRTELQPKPTGRYWWWYSPPQPKPQIYRSGNGKIKDGEFVFAFETPVAQQHYTYTIRAEVKDASLRTISGAASTTVTYAAFMLSADKGKYYYQQDEKPVINIKAENFVGMPVATEVKVEVVELLRNDGIRTAQTLLLSTDATHGEAKAYLSPLKPGSYRTTVTATDPKGRKVAASTNFYVVSPNQRYYSWWPQQDGVQIITDKQAYQAGETVKALVRIPHEAEALVTYQTKQLLHYETKRFESPGGAPKVEGAIQQLSFELPKNAYGHVAIFVGYTINDRVYYGQEQFTVIPVQQMLEVEIAFDAATYRPGAMAAATIHVRDAQGSPVPNANVTLATADEAIFSLYPDKSAKISEAFYKTEKLPVSSLFGNNFISRWGTQLLTSADMEYLLRSAPNSVQPGLLMPPKAGHTIQLIDERAEMGSIKGFVIDKESGLPLPDVRVQAGAAKARTNTYGYYELSPVSKMDSVLIFKGKGGASLTLGGKVANDDLSLWICAALENGKKRKAKVKESLQEMLIMAKQRGRGVATAARRQEMRAVDEGGAWEADAVFTQSLGVASTSSYYKGAPSPAGPAKKAVSVRQDFRDAIYWNADLVTNEFGQAKVLIKLPDNLTTWRSKAKVMTHDSKVGETIAKVTVKKDLLIRMETPQFAVQGDQMKIITNLHNYHSQAQEVEVSFETDGLQSQAESRNIRIKAGGEQRLDWAVSAKYPTEATLTVKAAGTLDSDGKAWKIPIIPHGLETFQSVTEYLSGSGKASMTVNIPKTVDLASVSMQVNAAPSVSASLLNALDDLVGYPYGCVEQTMSRFLPTLIVANTLETLGQQHAVSIAPKEMEKMVAQGVKRLSELQHDDGGWGWWTHDATHPFMTAYVVNGLFLAEKLGYQLPSDMLSAGKNALKNQLEAVQGRDATTHAYAAMVAHKVGLSNERISLVNPDSLGNAYEMALWLQAAHFAKDTAKADQIAQKLVTAANEQGSLAFWGGKKFYYSWRDDRVETTANAVQALLMHQPNHPLVPRAVQWLMSKRKGNSWHNTRQTAMTVFALTDLLKKEQAPQGEFELYVNGSKAGEGKLSPEDFYGKSFNFTLKGYRFTASKADAPQPNASQNLLKHGENKLEVRLSGKASLYLSGRLAYFLTPEQVQAQQPDTTERNIGFDVQREYFKLQLYTTETGKKLFKKIPLGKQPTVSSGDDILVKTTIKSKGEQEFMLIEDPIPAGCAFIRDRESYVIEGEAKPQPEGTWGWDLWDSGYASNWYTHTEYRERHYALTATSLSEGEYTYTYLLKAQVPGTFQVNPAVAMLMYYPEVRGFSGFAQVEIGE